MPATMTPKEAALSYAKYFDRPLAPIPQEKLDIFNGPPSDPALAMPFTQRNCHLDLKHEYLENGYGIALDGTGFVANATFMPGVTSAMMDWWFGWHCVESDLRYKIWDKDDHYYARAVQADYVKDPNVPWREKTWGVTHEIKEDIGFGPADLKLCFKRPRDLGYDESKIGTPGCTSMVCAAADALMTHKWYEAEGGIWFKSYFWMGVGLDEKGEVVRKIPEGLRMPEFAPKMLYGHNIKEFSNLAAILPQLYAEEWNGQPG